ncbi:DUF4352 domain-containing protein [Herbidospora galbida]|uniref:DUF4352 domain-containing protein n=1 Tax=Herbidospora galbida TaxID=2575442 RepID=A0A4U3MF37_9ACTN|nr:DUF4352 domain-containing protein [Herbidospora galbida]
MAVELQVKNTGAAVYSDALGNGLKRARYSQTFGDVKEGVIFSAVTANPGDSRKGVGLFEVPQDAKLTTLQLALKPARRANGRSPEALVVIRSDPLSWARGAPCPRSVPRLEPGGTGWNALSV